jgi:hypothetical protein
MISVAGSSNGLCHFSMPSSRHHKQSKGFELEDKTLLKFTRIFSGRSSEYRFNDEVNII